jgi:predicted O-linked N-acetylglucosamine transferase (SPINDLY family)
VEALGAAYALQPGLGEIGPHWVAMRQELCQWPLLALPGGADRAALLRALMPLTLGAYVDDPLSHLAAAAAFNRVHVPRGEIRPPVPPRPGPRRTLRIGYLSSDLRGHAVGSMMPRVFELHDRRRFEIVAYYTSARSLDALSLRLHRAADRWVDLAGLDDATAAARIAEDAVDILVDLNGYTRDARTAVVALRPAPVIVNWLGYPGTMGSPHHDAIIADDWIIPESHALYYSERVVRLPCYQPNDPTRPRPTAVPSRADLGLPDGAMVYCSFNSPHKLTPFTFARWMQILAQVPNSVLWLYAPGDETRVNLRAAAAAHGIEAGRVVFADRLPNAPHLARFPAADLFLDTAPYGAHTTGSDALWMGLPVLTLSGHSFASRVCGSLVRAAGLPELVTTSPEEYVALAVALGRDRDRLAGLRHRLEALRDTCVLFDMDGHVRALEAAYRGLWRDWRAGRLPRPDLTNLDAYLEVGATQDFDATDSVARPDYPAAYREGLARIDRYRPLRPDARLWPGPRTGAPDGPGDPP